ncbi:MAG: Gldg family protein [Spirochaetes bacterium]|nr:Gldg family protein [Spirochaetota bacterium]
MASLKPAQPILDLSRRLFGRYHRFALWFAVLVLANLAAVFLFSSFRIDLTRGGTYSLSKVSKRVVRNLKEPLYVKVFFTRNLPAPHNDTERFIRDLLTEYSIAGNRNFKVEYFDCTEGKTQAETSDRAKKNIKTAQDFGINPVGLQSVQSDKVEVLKAYMGVVFQRGDIIERLADLKDTRGLEYRITSLLQAMNQKTAALLSVNGKIRLRLFCTSALRDLAPQVQGVETVPDAVRAAFNKANDRNFGKLQLEILDNGVNPVLEAEATNYGLVPLRWREASGAYKSGFCSLVVDYNGKTEKIDLLAQQQGIDFARGRMVTYYQVGDLTRLDDYVNALVDALLQVNEDIGYLKDKGTLSTFEMPDDPRMARFNRGGQSGDGVNFKKMLEGTYKVKEVGASEVSKNVPALIIAGDKERFTDYELFLLDQYVMEGRPLIIFHDGLKEIKNDQGGMGGMYGQQSMPEYLPNETGLEKLLAHWGVSVDASYVCDTSCYEAVNPQMGQKQTVYFYPEISGDRINPKLRYLRGIRKLITIKASPVRTKDDVLKANRLTATELFGSSPRAWELRDQIMLQPGFIEPPVKQNMTNYSFGVVVEGEFPSYFADRGIPPKDDAATNAPGAKVAAAGATLSSTNAGFLKKGKKTRILVVGSSELLKNQILMDPSGDPPNFPWHNATFTMNVVDALYGREDWAAMRSKAQRFNPVQPYDPDANPFVRFFTNRTVFKVGNLAGIPALVILGGLIVWLRRRARRKAIQQRFLAA